MMKQPPTKPGPTELTFGKYKGQCIHDVADADPCYVEWLLDNTDCGVLNHSASEFVSEVRTAAQKVRLDKLSFESTRDHFTDDWSGSSFFDDDVPF